MLKKSAKTCLKIILVGGVIFLILNMLWTVFMHDYEPDIFFGKWHSDKLDLTLHIDDDRVNHGFYTIDGEVFEVTALILNERVRGRILYILLEGELIFEGSVRIGADGLVYQLLGGRFRENAGYDVIIFERVAEYMRIFSVSK